jgi:hypothetical protein
VLAVVAFALGAAGERGLALDVVLVGVVAAAVAGLEVVAAVVDGERSRTSAVLAALALLALVAAGAARRPELALGCLLCTGLDRLQLRAWVREVRAAESR